MHQLLFHLLLLSTRMPKQKTEELGSFLKAATVSLNRFCSCGRAAYGSLRSLSKASGLSKMKGENFLQTKTNNAKIGPSIRRFCRFKAFANNNQEVCSIDMTTQSSIY